MALNLDLESALQRIADCVSIEDFRQLMRDTSAVVVGGVESPTYLLYNGWVDDDRASTTAAHIRDDAARSDGLRTVVSISDTPVGQLLDDPEFKQGLYNAVARHLEANYPGYADIFPVDRPALINEHMQQILHGKTDGARTPSSVTSVWDEASRRYVETATGNFRIVAAGRFNPLSTLVLSELPALLANESVELIDGVPRIELAKDGLPDAVRRMELNAYTLSHFLQLSPDNTQSWVRLDPDEVKAAVADQDLQRSLIEKFSAPDFGLDLKDANSWMMDLMKRVADAPGGRSLLAIFGPITIGVSLLFASKDAEAASLAGDDAQAKVILEEWAAETLGSEIGFWGAGAIAALGGAAAVAAGTLPALVAGALVFGAALAGGILGGQGAVQLYRLMQDRDQNDRMDIVDKLSNLLFGTTTTIPTVPVLDIDGGKFTIDASLTPHELISSATHSIAWRYALRELNSFVVKDIDYETYNSDGSLGLVGEDGNATGMSREYLADRAQMLSWKLRFERIGARDADDLERTGPKPYNEDWDTSQIAGNWDYVDLTHRLPGGAPLELAMDGTGISLHDHQIVFGSAGNDTISGEGDSDRLYGGSGDDVIDGKEGDDYLEGGAGDDRFVFGEDFGKDVLFDSDGEGSIQIGGDVLGQAVATGLRNTWRMKMTDGRFVDLVLRQDAASATGYTLLIQDGSNAISIRHFNLARAQSEDGYLGIKLETGTKVALLGRAQNFWADPGADIATLAGSVRSMDEGSARAFSVSLSQAARAGDTITLQLLGLSGKGISFFVEGEEFIGDSVSVALKEGQTQLAFAVAQSGDLAADATGALKVVLTGQNGTSESNTLSLVLHNYGEESTQITGDLMARTTVATEDHFRYDQWGQVVAVVQAGAMVFERDAQGNLVSGGEVLVTDNVIYGTGERDDIDGGVGNDLVAGGGGDDILRGGAGGDLIVGGAGNDVIYGGDGDDFISSAADADPGLQQVGPQDLWGFWGFPTGATVLASGATWGVYTLEGQLFWSGVGAPGTADQSDVIDGGDGDDRVLASWGDDRILGGAGADTVFGLAGADILDGGDGDDQLWGDGDPTVGTFGYAPSTMHGNDFIDGGEGNDLIVGGGRADQLFGGSGNDVLRGDSTGRPGEAEFLAFEHHGDDFIDGQDGDDVAEGNGGNDTLYGGAGDDGLYGDTAASRMGDEATNTLAWGADFLDGGAGNDHLIGGGGNDTLYGGEDDDLLEGDESSDLLPGVVSGSDYLDGGAGNDTLIGGGNDDHLYGGSGNDVLLGDDREGVLEGAIHGKDLLDGGEGDDTLLGGGGDDRLFGGTGDDVLAGDDNPDDLAVAFHGNDYLDGGGGNDSVIGGGGNDILLGGTGADTLIGDAGEDGLPAGDGNDWLDGGDADDQLFGNGGDDQLIGGDGNDVLVGGAGNDTLLGGSGSNQLYGGDGDDLVYSTGGDYLQGGAGNDTYDLTGASESSTVSIIDDAEGINQLLLNGSLDDYRIYVEGGMTYLASEERVVVGFTAQTNLVGIQFEGEDRSLQDLIGEDGRIGSMTWVDGALVSTKVVNAPQLLRGSGVADALEGGSGYDEIIGGVGADLIIGGKGNDVLRAAGIQGDDDDVDVYRFDIGDGADRIEAPLSGGSGVALDIIEFGEGISAETIGLIPGQGSGGSAYADMVISYGDGDSITLSRGAFAQIAEFRFADGTSLSRDEILWRLSGQAGASGEGVEREAQDDTDGVLIGGSGADLLMGGAGNDTLIGGAGNDQLAGGDGRNVYVFAPDSGLDVIYPGSSWNRNEIGILQFTGAALSDLQVFQDGLDLVLRQSSGAMVRIRDLDWDIVSTWKVQDSAGVQASLEALLGTHGLPAFPSLESRRDHFIALQQSQLATLPQRDQWDGASFVVPTSISQVAMEVGADGSLVHSNYLDAHETVRTTVQYVSTPVYEVVTEHKPPKPARVVKVEDLFPDGAIGIQLPEGAIPVYGPSPGGGGPIVAYILPEEPAETVSRSRLVRYEVHAEYGQTISTDDTARQLLVSGSDGDDLIVPALEAGGIPAAFRGTISTGAGDDQVLLGNHGNFEAHWPWEVTRFDDWGIAMNWVQGQQPSSYFERGLGAWIDVGDGDDVVHGTDGDDFIIGGAGNDYMDGQGGADTYYVSFRAGEVDRISDLAYHVHEQPVSEMGGTFGPGEDTVEFDDSVSLTSLSYSWVRSPVVETPHGETVVKTLQLFMDGQRFLEIDYLVGSGPDLDRAGIEWVQFADGARMSVGELLDSLPLEPLAPPIMIDPPGPVMVAVDGQVSLDLLPHFGGADGAYLTFSIEAEGDGPVPEFVFIDHDTGELTAFPGAEHVGAHSVRVVATDPQGQSISVVIQLGVGENAPPVVTGTIPGPLLPQPGDALREWLLPIGIFSDPDAGGPLTYSLHGEYEDALPSWLHFDATTGLLSGSPPPDAIAQGVRLRATDQWGASTEVDLQIRIAHSAQIGGEGDDILQFPNASAILSLYGDAGDDMLASGSGNDVLDGGAGNDTLSGGAGQDAYVFSGSFGQDVVDDVSSETDHVYLRGWSSLDFSAFRDADGHLILQGRSSGERVQFLGAANPDSFIFHFDDVTWDVGQVLVNLFTPSVVEGTEWDDDLVGGDGADSLLGFAGNDYLTGDAGNDWLDGGAGDDVLWGNAGDDWLIGGAGDDVLQGGEGADTYVLDLAFGKDLIWDDSPEMNHVQMVGWASGDFVFAAGPYGALVLRSSSSADWLMIEGWFHGANAFEIHFEDVTLTASDVESRLGTLWVSEQDDIFIVEDGESVDALGGNDQIILVGDAGVADGNVGDDMFAMDAGTYVVRGGAGDDNLWGNGGRAIFEGEGGSDMLDVANSPAHFLAGGAGNDAISIYSYDSEARHLVAFNAGDGQDVVWVSSSNGEFGVLSVGGFDLDDVTLGVDEAWDSVTIHFGASDSVTYSGWLSAADAQSPRHLLQLIEGDEVRLFDLAAAVQQLRAAIASGGSLSWSSTELLAHEQVVEPGWAYGGQLAVAYAEAGSTRGLSDAMLQQWISAPGFGETMQAFAPSSPAGMAFASSGLESGVQSLVSAMAAFSPPAAGETNSWPMHQTPAQNVLAANCG